MATYILKDSFTEADGTFSHISSFYTKIMQSFTASSDYLLARLALWVGGTIHLSDQLPGGIYSMSGGIPDEELATFTITVTTVLTNPTKTYVNLDTPLLLESGTQYAIVLFHPNVLFSTFVVTRGRFFDEDHYPEGEALRYDEGAGIWEPQFETGYVDIGFELYSEYALTPTPAHEITGIVLYPTLSWTVD